MGLSVIMAGIAVFFVMTSVSSIEEDAKKKFGNEVTVLVAKQDIKERLIGDVLRPGIEQRMPIEPIHHEPRDRFDEFSGLGKKQEYKKQIVISKSGIFGEYNVTAYNENGEIDGGGKFTMNVDTPDAVKETVSALKRSRGREGWTVVDLTKENIMSEISKFRNMIRECISEIKKERDPKIRLKESLRSVVKDVLNEIANITKPELDKDEKETISKGYFKKGNERVGKTNDKQLTELETIVHAIDPTWEAYWDDHNQLIVRAHNLLYVRICPKYENNYDIDAMVKLVDRIRAIALTWDQVKAFIKANFSDLKNKTIPDQLYKKSIDNHDDKEVIKKDAGPEKAKVNVRYQDPKNPSVKDTKRDDMNYNEPQTKRDEDMPDQPMKQVTDPGKDPESKNKNITKTDRVKPPKHKNDKMLKASDKKTPKFTAKKTTGQ